MCSTHEETEWQRTMVPEWRKKMPDHAEKMMDEFDRWIGRFLKLAAVVILLVAFLLFAFACWGLAPEPPRREVRQFTAAEKRWIGERHRYHGISSSVADIETGELYFFRDGQRCKL
jgi:hypothetical protein